MKIKTSALIATAFLATNAFAEIELGQYSLTKNMEQVKTYVTGLGKGVFWADAYLSAFKREPLLCIPDGIEINQDVIISALNKEIKSGDYSAKDTVESIVPMALMKRFPCPADKRP